MSRPNRRLALPLLAGASLVLLGCQSSSSSAPPAKKGEETTKPFAHLKMTLDC